MSFNNRPLQVIANDVFNPTPVDGDTTVAVGAGISVDIRPTVAIVGEAIYRVSERLGEHRPAFMLGIQKKVFRHSFTLGLTNSPGTTLSTRSATRGSYGGGTFDDTFSGLTIGFNLSRTALLSALPSDVSPSCRRGQWREVCLSCEAPLTNCSSGGRTAAMGFELLRINPNLRRLRVPP